MEFDRVLRSRRSIRKFKDKKVESAKLTAVLEAAKYAPSAHNLQSYTIYVAKDEEKRGAIMLTNIYGQKFIKEAPVVLVVCANTAETAKDGGARARFYSIQDAALAAYAMILKAHSIGLATCWVGAFDDKALGKALKLPEHRVPVAVVPLGYGAEKPAMPKRREDYVRKF